MADRQRSRGSSSESSSDCGFEVIDIPIEVINNSNWCTSDDEWNEMSASRCHAEYFFIGGADSPRGSDEVSDTEAFEILQLQTEKTQRGEEEKTAVPELAKRRGARDPLRKCHGVRNPLRNDIAKHRYKDLEQISAAVAIEAECLSNVLANAEEANASLLAKLSALSAAEGESLHNVLATAAAADARLLEKISAASALEVEFLNKGLASAAA